VYRSARLSVLTLALAARAASADDASEATELFKQGRELTRAGKDKEACPLFEKSMKLVPAIGTELNLARCYAATGRLVEAKKLFDDLTAKTADVHQKERAELVKEGLTELEGKMPHLKIDKRGLRALVEIDGEVVDVAEPVAVDPGHHEVTADGAKPASVDIAEGETKSVVLEPLEREVKPPENNLKLGFAAGGAALLVAGTIAGITVIRESNAGRDRCAPDMAGTLVCDQRGIDLLDRAHNLSHLTTVFLIGGLGLSATAAYMEYRDRKKRAPVASLFGSASSFGITIGGAW
jgi:hypothetical protein